MPYWSWVKRRTLNTRFRKHHQVSALAQPIQRVNLTPMTFSICANTCSTLARVLASSPFLILGRSVQGMMTTP